MFACLLCSTVVLEFYAGPAVESSEQTGLKTTVLMEENTANY